MAGKNILVTGGAGFIGSHIVKTHIAKGDQVWAVDNLSSGRLENIDCEQSNLQFSRADLMDWPEMVQAVQWADRIYHMAAIVGQRLVIEDPVKTLKTNIAGCENILETMNKYGRNAKIIIASTSSVYINDTDERDEGLKEDDEIKFYTGEIFQQGYPLSKFVNELTALSYLRKNNVQCVIARIFNTIGTGQSSHYGMVVPTFIEQALDNKPVTVYGDGSQTRSFCNVQDTVTALDLLIENPECVGEVVNVGKNQEISILDLAKLIIKKCGSSSKIEFIPYVKAYGIKYTDIARRLPNIEKLKYLTGFTPKITLEQTIEEIKNTIKTSP